MSAKYSGHASVDASRSHTGQNIAIYFMTLWSLPFYLSECVGMKFLNINVMQKAMLCSRISLSASGYFIV